MLAHRVSLKEGPLEEGFVRSVASSAAVYPVDFLDAFDGFNFNTNMMRVGILLVDMVFMDFYFWLKIQFLVDIPIHKSVSEKWCVGFFLAIEFYKFQGRWFHRS